MYRKEPNGYLFYKHTAKGYRYSKGYIMLRGEKIEIEVYMMSNKPDGNPNFKIYFCPKDDKQLKLDKVLTVSAGLIFKQ